MLLLLSCNSNKTETPVTSTDYAVIETDLATWKVKGGNAEGTQYSSLSQINKDNVRSLKLAWDYKSGDADTIQNRSQIQCNPIIVDGVLYATSPILKAFALDAATGKEIWKFKSENEGDGGLGVNRGVTYWEHDGDKRILYSVGEYLYALDARTGKKISDFAI